MTKVPRADLARIRAIVKEIHSSNVEAYAYAVKEKFKYDKRSKEYGLAVLNEKYAREKMEKSARASGDLLCAEKSLDDLGVLE